MPYLDLPGPLGFAHRGGAAAGDENTTEAFARAVGLGYRFIETDTHATADGVPVVFHDSTLQRILGRPGRMTDVRFADLGGAVPRLDDVLAAWPEVRFNIDCKSDASVGPTWAAVQRAGAQDRVLLASHSSARLARMRALTGPSVASSLGMREVATLWSGYVTRRRVKVAAGVVAAQIPPSYGRVRLATPGFIRYVHGLGLQVHLWTIDEADRIGHFLDMGADGIMTDHIEVLRAVYVTRGIWPN